MKPWFQRLLIPTYDGYDFERDSGGLDYVPPPLLNNYIILYTNAIFELAQPAVEASKRLQVSRKSLLDAQRAFERFRRRVLVKERIPSAYSKTNALIDAFVAERCQATGQLEEYERLEQACFDAESDVERWKQELSGIGDLVRKLETACENIKTHLSYVKAEQRATV